MVVEDVRNSFKIFPISEATSLKFVFVVLLTENSHQTRHSILAPPSSTNRCFTLQKPKAHLHRARQKTSYFIARASLPPAAFDTI